MRRSTGLCSIASVLALACAPDAPPRVDEGEHVVVHSEVPWCAETTPWLDVSIERIATFFGIPPGEIAPIAVHHYESSAGVQAVCALRWREMLQGCAIDSTAVSVLDVHLHEIVHAVAFQVGRPPPWFQEGVAMLLTDGPMLVVAPDRARLSSIARYGAFHEPSAEETNYDLAASFVGLLHDELGREALVELYRITPYEASFDEVDALLQAHSGRTLDDLLTRWEERGARWPWELALNVVACGGPLDEADDGGFELRPGVTAYRPITDPDLGALARLAPIEGGWVEAWLSTADCPMIAASVVDCDRAAAFDMPFARPGASIGHVVFVDAMRDPFVELRAYTDGAQDSGCPAPCQARFEVAPARLEGECGALRVPLTPEVEVEVEGPFTHLALHGEVERVGMLPRGSGRVSVCELDAPCGEPIACGGLAEITTRTAPERYFRLTGEDSWLAVRVLTF